MSRRLIVRAEAEFDITEAAVWYEGREPGLGLQLTAEIRAAIQRALQDPLAFLRLRKHPNVRASGGRISISRLLHSES